MIDSGPLVVATVPPRETLTPAPDAISVTFDRAMDVRRGRLRLVWGRISAHFVNSRRRSWRWSLRDPALGWSPDRLTLQLTLPRDCPWHGFRVRVEWSDLRDAEGHCPVGAEPGGIVSYVLAVQRPPAPPPTLTSKPPPQGSLRPDEVIELYPSSPVGQLTPERWALTVDGIPQPFTLRTNRNPPDWIYLHPLTPLPLGRGRLQIPEHGVLGTDGSPLAGPFDLHFAVEGSPVVAVPHPEWTEPPPGFVSLPRSRPTFALRFSGRPSLAPGRFTLEDASGVLASDPVVSHDPTPGHYRSLVLDFDAELPADVPVRLCWSALQPGGAPGSLPYRTGPPRPIAPLANAASIFATPRGSFLQVHAGVHGDIRRVVVRGDGWSQELTPAASAFTPAGGTPRRAFRSPEDSPPLPPLDEPALRAFEVLLVDALGERALPGVAFDMTRGAVTNLAVAERDDGLHVSWDRHAPTDSVHLCALRDDGAPAWSGLFASSVSRATVPRAWLDDRVVAVQLWLVRARPEDDLWDYFIDEASVPTGT